MLGAAQSREVYFIIEMVRRLAGIKTGRYIIMNRLVKLP
jgi:hypothetical protein